MILLHSWIVTTNQYPPTSAIKWVRKTPKKAIHPLVYEHDPVLQAIGGVFSAKPTFVRATRGKPAIGESEEKSKPAIGDGVLWTTMQARRSRAQLGESSSRSTEPRRVGCGKPPQVRTCHPWYTRCAIFLRQAQFFFGEADFFSAKRLFLRNGEGGEWRASRVTVCVTAKDNGEACFPLDFGFTHTIGRQPSPPHRGDFLFVSCHISSHLWVACHNRPSDGKFTTRSNLINSINS